VRVAPSRSATAIAGQTVRDIGRQLRVSHVLDGSIQGASSDGRVIATLIEAERESQATSAIVLDGPISLTLAFQRSLAADIAARFESALRSRARLTEDADAYHAFKRGYQQWISSRYAGGWRAAVDHFQHAIDRDPQFVAAHVALARVYNFLAYYCLMRPNLAFSVAERLAQRALDIDAACAAAVAELASTRFGRDWDWDGAEALFRRAIDLDRSDAQTHVHYSWLLALVGRVPAALAEAKTAADLAPTSPLVWPGARTRSTSHASSARPSTSVTPCSRGRPTSCSRCTYAVCAGSARARALEPLRFRGRGQPHAAYALLSGAPWPLLRRVRHGARWGEAARGAEHHVA